VIEEVINALLAPLTTVLANATLLAEMGSEVSSIALYDTELPVTTSSTPIANCYVRLYDNAVVTPLDQFLGGAYLEWQEMVVEYVAYGSTAKEVNERINYLRIAVERQIKVTLSNLASIQLTDLTGSGAYQKVNSFLIVSTPQMPNGGPNKDPDVPQWKRPRYSKVRIMVLHGV
jgi:hypothetical protein